MILIHGPRYTIPANHLEIFDLALVACGELDGILKYMYDYRHPLGFEDGYDMRHRRNEKAVKSFRLYSPASALSAYVYSSLCIS